MTQISFSQSAIPVYLVDSASTDNYALTSKTYQLASNVALAATTGGAPVSGIAKDSYLWDTQFTGTSITLQSLGADGVTWRNVQNVTTSGTVMVNVGQNATMRLYNPNTSALTNVWSNLS